MHTLAILFSTVIKNNLAFKGLQRQWVLSTNPRLRIASLDIEDAIVHILSVFQDMWTFSIILIRKFKDEIDDVPNKINSTRFQMTPFDLRKLLTENICIRNRDVSEGLRVSPKTAIKYLKQLEHEGVLLSIKDGREIFYFNNILVDLTKQMTEGFHNG